MQKFNQAVKLWLGAKRCQLSLWVFNLLWRDPMSGMKDIIENAITQRVFSEVMVWLDERNYLHCFACPETKELRNYGAGKLCARHYAMAEKQNGVPGIVQ